MCFLETENVLIKAVSIDLNQCIEPCVFESCFYLTYVVWNMCERAGAAVMLTIISSYNLVCQSVQYLLQSTVEYSVCYNIIYTSCGNKINVSVESTPQTTKVQLTLYVTDIGETFTVALTRCQSCLLLLDFKLFLDRFNQHFRSYIFAASM